MQDLLIVGAGGFARELANWLRDSPDCGNRWRLKGFLDDDPQALEGHGVDLPLLGGIADHQPAAGELLVCGLGTPALKQRVCEALSARGGRFQTFVHPSARVGPGIEVGAGSVFCPGVVLTTNIRVGRFVTLNIYATVGHDVRVGDWCTCSAHCDLTSCTRLGERVLLGSRACLRPGVELADDAVVGAGSAVYFSVPERTTVVGVPARTAYVAPAEKRGAASTR